MEPRYKLTLFQRLQWLPCVVWYFLCGYEISYRVTLVGGSMVSMGTKSLHIEVTAIGELENA